MADGNGVGALAQLAYAAAIDDELWPAWAEAMRRHFGAVGIVFGVLDLQTARIKSGLFHFPDGDVDRVIPEYAEHMAAHDPVLRRLAQCRGSEIFDNADAHNLDDAEDAEYHRWQLARLGIRRNLTAAVAIHKDLCAGVTLNWAPGGPAGASARSEVISLFPHLQQAMKLGLRHSQLLQAAWWDGHQAGDSGAAMLLDDHGRVLRASRAAEVVIACGDGLDVRAGRLAAVAPDCDDKLQLAIAGALDEIGPQAGSAKVARRSGRPPYQVTVHPLPRSRRFLAPNQAAAIVRIVRPETACARLSPLHRDLLGFTEREAEVAELLLSGHSLESLAQAIGIRHNTVRNHLQSIFRKTGTNRQSDLVRLLMNIEKQLH